MSRLRSPLLSAPFSCPAMCNVGRAMRNPVFGPSAILILVRPHASGAFDLPPHHAFELLCPDRLGRLRRRARGWLCRLVVLLNVDLELVNHHRHMHWLLCNVALTLLLHSYRLAGPVEADVGFRYRSLRQCAASPSLSPGYQPSLVALSQRGPG